MTPLLRCLGFILGVAAVFLVSASSAFGSAVPPTFVDESLTTSGVLRTTLTLGLFAFLPALFICTTSFIRIVIVLAMVRHAFGMPETPPNIVLVALAMFFTAYIMGPTFAQLQAEAIMPFLAGELTPDEAYRAASAPMREFMLRQVREEDLISVYTMTNTPLPSTPEEVELLKLIPAFILNELRVAFTIGFVVLLPFLMIELVVASILLSLGMMMVPPATISLPIKVLMFVLIDGWVLIVQGVLNGFQ